MEILSIMPLRSVDLNELFAALSKAQGKMETASKSSYNPVFKSRYADWETIKNASQQPLSENGLAISQMVVQIQPDFKILYTMLGHSSGQFIASTWHINPRPIITREGKVLEVTIQNEGAFITYAKRYSYAAIIGLSIGEDDDGEKASGKYHDPTNDYRQANTLTPPQIKALRDALNLLPSADDAVNAILNAYKISSLDNLTQDQYYKSMESIQKSLLREKV